MVTEACPSVLPSDLTWPFTLQFELPCSVNRWNINTISLKSLGKQKAAHWTFFTTSYIHQLLFSPLNY